MKLTQSLVAIATLSTLSFAGGDINPITVFEQEPVFVPVEAVPVEVVPDPEPVYVAPTAPTVVVEPPVVVQPPAKVIAPIVPAATPLGLYVAGGISALAARETHEDWANVFADEKNQDRQLGFTGRLGYDFMDYLGAELRGAYGFTKVDNGYSKIKNIGAYLKPNYNLTDDFNLYALVGVANSNLADITDAETGLSYGAGIDYDITNNISVFTDMVNYMHKSDVPESWGLTVGAAYNF